MSTRSPKLLKERVRKHAAYGKRWIKSSHNQAKRRLNLTIEAKITSTRRRKGLNWD